MWRDLRLKGADFKMGIFKKMFNKEPKPGKPQAVTDETFEQMVLATGTPAVVDFWSSTCAPCQVMSGLLEEIGPEFAGRVNIYKLNTDQNPQSAIQYQIRGVPTLILFKDHRPVERITGLIPLNPLKEKLEKLARQK
jgi:thioredoxin 1